METLGSPVDKKEIHNQSVDMSEDETCLMWIAWNIFETDGMGMGKDQG